MGSDSVMVEAKNEYTHQLIDVLLPQVIKGVQSIYEDARTVCVANNEEELSLITFQQLLGEIPNWNNSVITQECQRIILDAQCNYIGDLLTLVFICHTKILASVRTSHDKKIKLQLCRRSIMLKKPRGGVDYEDLW